MPALVRYFDRSFGRYALTSAAATGSDFVAAFTLHALGLSPAWATFVGCVVGGSVAFTLNREWTFRAGTARALPQFLRFMFVWGTSALLNSCGVPALLPWLGSFPLTWGVVRAGVYLGWNYPLSRWFVFAGEGTRRELSAR